jgi:acetyl-CoA C-acetyltransferase
MAPDDVMLLGGVRTPFGRFGGALRSVPSVELGAFAMRAALTSTGVPADRVDEVYYGVTIPAEEALDGSIPGRVAMLKAGIPDDRLSLTIDRACCSSMTGTHLATYAIQAGRSNVVLVGGADNMGRAAFLISPEIRWGVKRGLEAPKDPMLHPGADIGNPVAQDAGEVALEWGIGRAESDAWAARSHREYFRAKGEGFFDDQIVPYPLESRRGGTTLVTDDELPREDVSEEQLGALRTVLGSPTVTPGNAPGQDTGGCFIVLASRRACEELGLEPLARIASTGSIARTPREIAVAPAPAILKTIEPLGWTVDDLDRIEINEAFACVPLTSARVLADGDAEREERIRARLNVNGGAVAIGHPAGASGARLVLTLAQELRRRGGGRGAASICGGLGMGDAAAIEVFDV